MSASLMMRPKKTEGEFLPDELRFILTRQLQPSGKKLFDTSDAHYLQGLADAQVNGAEQLLEFIKLHGEVIVWESY